MLEHERNSLTNCWSVQRVAWSQEERQSCHTPGEVSSASWANCWWVMMYGMEKVRLIHWMNSHDGYEQVLCTCLFVLSLVSSYIGMWHRRQEFHGSLVFSGLPLTLRPRYYGTSTRRTRSPMQWLSVLPFSCSKITGHWVTPTLPGNTIEVRL